MPSTSPRGKAAGPASGRSWSFKLWFLVVVVLLGVGSLALFAVTLSQPPGLGRRRRGKRQPIGLRRKRPAGEGGEEEEPEEEEEEPEEEDPQEEEEEEAATGEEEEQQQQGAAGAAAVSASDLEHRVATGKIYFLFLLKDSLPHANVWQAFFQAAPAGAVGLYAHCTNSSACKQSGDLRTLGLELVQTVPSKWCADLVSPMWQVLRTALRADSSWAAGRGPRKYIFVSDSTLPIRSFDGMRQILMKSDHSDMCISPENEWGGVDIFGAKYRIVKSHQWAVLNHADAESFARGWEQLNSYSAFVKDQTLTIGPGEYKWAVPRMGRDGRANFSATIQRSMIPAPGRCPDEEVLTTLVFGLHEPQHARRWQGIIERSVCRTYVNWGCPNPPEVFSRVTDSLLQLSKDTSDSTYFFARKFSPKSKLDDLRALLMDGR